ncbi:peptide/nickel transport system permease protein [Actinoplanes lutulentus]|uniref:Peptide/nickel transport system permease protein n=1 Tax=Actinoplanes lutulentus TaxID=1287878 RepID=A0A327Z561_9ACTN|nr:ABC transporter permease [Actinoplanes lutulentus]MBB2946294.1 peptide/nickel transport system permease protein [Actinoplanes lutulentus]RAK28767.1 peptide/nickel transport system permease protein [Actinoplanes lutulentus]
MTSLDLAEPVPGATVRRRARGLHPVLIGALTVIFVIVLAALFAPLLAPYPPGQTDVLAIGQGPSAAHLLGTDDLGRDIVSRLLYGARLSLFGPAIVTLGATVLGSGLAVLAAWKSGLWDQVITRALDILFAFPSVLIAILAVAVTGAGLTGPIIALSIAYIPFVARVVRAEAVRQRHLPYIEAGQLLGFSPWRIAVRHLGCNILPLVAAQAILTFATALVDLAAISFLGLGVQAPDAEWGLMVSAGNAALINGNGWQSLSAGALIVLTVLAFNVVGERLDSRKELT